MPLHGRDTIHRRVVFMKDLGILSLGFTRSLWEGKNGEDVRRLSSYAENVKFYDVIVNSYRKHRLQKLQLSANFVAIPTNALCLFDALPRMFWAGVVQIRKQRPSLITAQDPFFCGSVAFLLSKLYKIPYNICIFGPNIYDPHWVKAVGYERILRFIATMIFRSASGLQVDGRMTAARFIKAGHDPRKVFVKPMVPANLDGFLQIQRTRKTESGSVRILFVGRLVHQKNLPFLFKAVAAVRKRTSVPCELLIVGEGLERSCLEKLSEELGLQVSFLGQKNRTEILEIFVNADVFVLSSFYEGFPRVLMEAAASGLPIVTTAVSGSDEAVVDGKGGFVVDVGDLAQFESKLLALLNSVELRNRMGVFGREHIGRKLGDVEGVKIQLSIWNNVAGGS